jgi:hypothetical protein
VHGGFLSLLVSAGRQWPIRLDETEVVLPCKGGPFVIPAKAGTQPLLITAFALSSRFRGNDGKRSVARERSYAAISIEVRNGLEIAALRSQ